MDPAAACMNELASGCERAPMIALVIYLGLICTLVYLIRRANNSGGGPHFRV